MKLETVKVSTLKQLEKNVRRHSDIQIRELIKSYEQFGQTRAIVVDEDNNILIGNGLHMALVKKGVEDCVVYRKVGLSEKDKKKLILTDNKTYSLGVDDFENIEDYIKDIVAEGDLDIAGFDSEFISQITRELEEITADVKDYGIISLEDKQKLEQAKPVPPTQSTATPIYTPATQGSEQSNDDNEQTAEPYTPQESEDTEVQEQPQEVPNTTAKTCVCPNCGEVIPLD